MKQLTLILALIVTTMTFAQNKNAKASMEVDGVCGMCKERIEKAAIRTKGVKSAVWNVDTHELKLIYDERKTDLKTISKHIAAVGPLKGHALSMFLKKLIFPKRIKRFLDLDKAVAWATEISEKSTESVN